MGLDCGRVVHGKIVQTRVDTEIPLWGVCPQAGRFFVWEKRADEALFSCRVVSMGGGQMALIRLAGLAGVMD